MRIITALVCFIFILLNSVPPVYALSSSNPPEIHGEGAYLIDVQSGQTLYSKNGDGFFAPASTTKIMTGLLAIEEGNLDDVVTLSSTMLDYKTVYGTRIYLEPGEKMPLRDLLYALLLNSANDAAVGIAEHIGGSLPQFVFMMNEKAKELGLKNTTFKNPSGLTNEGHVTTPHDLARIAQAAYANPIFRNYVQTQRHTITRSKSDVPTEMINENKLLGQNPYINGMKTGYTEVAKNCLVASASKDGRDLIAVILKSQGREIYTDMENLLNYGFSQFQTTVYKPAGSAITQTTIGTDEINLVLSKPIYTTEKMGEPSSKLTLKIIPAATNLTEVEQGQTLGTVEVWEGNEKLENVPLTSDRSVKHKLSLHNSSPWAAFFLLVIMLGIILFYAQTKRSSAHRFQRTRKKKKKTQVSK
ncbi:D-alanyl-D-alanine carboxypeptidase family protein [Desulfitobacterium metallireducens]|uniref:serine-type D-Ala-D-Ala carboxypeptidase n=1 Tax=Desulfitobacterium metallireducens DSM 15288 TaxID=871968 RepID=W0E852_9FIRM|nr:D-alanyl-D-alanine carboxypeptidase family protein [Desulfitobacterium metallireducens]AHF06947.1 D-alanyl-D-alanine carboxypeptidase [Desulfitobacterium metallireducens DSM 15288]